jgi:hypothetical protein
MQLEAREDDRVGHYSKFDRRWQRWYLNTLSPQLKDRPAHAMASSMAPCGHPPWWWNGKTGIALVRPQGSLRTVVREDRLEGKHSFVWMDWGRYLRQGQACGEPLGY